MKTDVIKKRNRASGPPREPKSRASSGRSSGPAITSANANANNLEPPSSSTAPSQLPGGGGGDFFQAHLDPSMYGSNPNFNINEMVPPPMVAPASQTDLKRQRK